LSVKVLGLGSLFGPTLYNVHWAPRARPEVDVEAVCVPEQSSGGLGGRG
jgi:hypothetical protein